MDSISAVHSIFGSDWPDETRLPIWHKGEKRSEYIEPGSDVSDSKDLEDVYLGVALIKGSKGARGRARASDAVAIGGVWADVDINGGPEGKTGAAPNVEEAHEVIEEMGGPTVLVNSGYGFQAWWLLEELWVFGSDAEREQAARVVKGWQGELRRRANEHGWTIDATHDLARLMRLPGTLNGKGGGKGVPVTILEDDGPRYDLSRLARWADASRGALISPIAAPPVSIQAAELPRCKFDALLVLSPEFAATWEREKNGHWSQSEYDLSLASQAARAEWGDGEIVALIRAHRKKWDQNSDKGARMDYVERTIAKAREGLPEPKSDLSEEHRRIDEEERRLTEKQAALTERRVAVHRASILGNLGEPGESEIDETTRQIVYDEWDELLGLPPRLAMKGLEQQGETLEDARFILLLGNERARVGAWNDLANPQRLIGTLACTVGHVPTAARRADQRWWRALKALIEVRTQAEPLGEEAAHWLTDYYEQGLRVRSIKEATTPEDVGAAYGRRAAWTRGGELFIPFGGLSAYLQDRRLPHRLAELRLRLKAAGYEPRKVARRSEDGKSSTARYWVGKIPGGEEGGSQ